MRMILNVRQGQFDAAIPDAFELHALGRQHPGDHRPVEGPERVRERHVHDEAIGALVARDLAVVDEIAAAADLVMGKADAIPVAVVRGLDLTGDGRATDLIRPPEEDMFR